MGYRTSFVGNIKFNHKIDGVQAQLLNMQIQHWVEKRYIYSPWKIEQDYKGEYVLKCEDGKSLNYIDWLKYLIEELSKMFVLNGKVLWRGEDYTDNGQLIVRNNVLTVYKCKYVKQ